MLIYVLRTICAVVRILIDEKINVLCIILVLSVDINAYISYIQCKMISKTFMTNDSNGCQFEVKAFYGTKELKYNYDLQEWETIQEKNYTSMGINVSSLEELKIAVSLI